MKFREDLLTVEEGRVNGRSGHSIDELDAYLTNIIDEVEKKAVQYKIIVSDLAWGMLSTHVRFLAEASPDAAKKYC